jgi:hypothetical protein
MLRQVSASGDSREQEVVAVVEVRSLAVVMLCTSCAAKAHVVASPASFPSAPTAPVATGLEDASEVVKMYDHDTTDPDNSMPTVGGYVLVHAPLAAAFEVATEFGEYRYLNPDYIETSKVVDRNGPSVDLYLKVPTIIGDYVWAVVRFEPVPTKVGYAYSGREVKGNLDDLRIFWRIVPVSADVTIAQFEFLADPHLPIPRPWILPEVREGVRIILNRFRAKAEYAAHYPQRIFDAE